MNFWCSLFTTENYHAQIYLPTSKKKPALIGHSQIRQQENPQANRRFIRLISNNTTIVPPSRIVPVQRMQSSTTIASLRSAPQKQSSHHLQYLLLESRNIQKGEISELLKYKEKLVPKQNQSKEDVVVRMIIKSDYDAIAKSSEYNSKKKWEDKSFPPNPTFKNPINNQIIQLQWKSLDSLSTLMNIEFSFMQHPFSVDEVKQGALVGDCYFLSAVAALTRKPQRIEKLFPATQSNSGIYMARIMVKGVLQEVIVDDRFPVIKGTKDLLGCKPSKDQNQIYVMVLQKCWAKLWKSYEAIDGGFPHDALHALSGALTKNYNLYNETSTKETKQSFFKQVLGFCELQYVMCTGTDHQEHRMIQLQGNINIKISPSHCYCIQNVYEENGKNMVTIYNPWGLNKQDNGHDILGHFDLTWDQYVTNFQYLAVAKVCDNANYLFTELKNCQINQFTFIELNIFNKVKGYYGITVSQTYNREKSLKSAYMTVTYIVLRCNKDPKTQAQTYQLKTIRSEYKFCDHYLQLGDMIEGNYLICIYFSNADGIKQNLNFGVYSQDNFGIKQKNFPKQMHHLILEQALISYDYKSPSERVALTNRKDAWYSFNMMINNSIFGYILLHSGSAQKEKAKIQAGGKAFKQANLTVMKPYDIEEIIIDAQPGHETIAIIRIDNLSQYMQRQNEYFKMGKHLHKQRIQIKQIK